MKLKEYLHKIYFLTGKNISAHAFIIFLFIINSILDLIGIGLISAYISILISPEIFKNFISSYQILHSFFFFENYNISLYVGVFLILVFLFKFLLSTFTYSIIVNFSHKTQRDVRYKILTAYQNLDFEKYILKSSSESIAATGMYVKNYGAVLVGLLLFIGDVIIGSFIIALLFYVNGIILLSMLIFLSLVIGIYKLLFLNQSTFLGEKLNIGYAKMYQGIQEFYDGFKELKILNNYDFFQDKILSSTNLVANSDIKQNIITFVPRYLIELAIIIFLVTVVTTSTLIFESVNSLIPILSIFGAAAIRLAPMFNQITRFFGIFRYGKDAVEKLYKEVSNLDLPFKIDKFLELEATKEFKSLALRDISYKYPNSNNSILNHISLKIDKGDVIGIIGPSGSGKTTLIDIILGLLRPQDGEIFLNNQVLERETKLLTNKVAYLPQETFLINDTIAKNVALGLIENQIDKKRVEDAIKKSQLKDFLEKLPNGIDSMINERGINISGGQKQRIALARAFYFNREILVFDEATSALDEKVETEIIDQVNLLKGNKTIILISHRSSTIKHCNKIYEINDGNVEEVKKVES